jgi:hypothetical protein
MLGTAGKILNLSFSELMRASPGSSIWSKVASYDLSFEVFSQHTERHLFFDKAKISLVVSVLSKSLHQVQTARKIMSTPGSVRSDQSELA